LVIYASDSDAIAREIVDRRRDLLGYYYSEGSVTAGRDALEHFASEPRAIRWWHVSRTTGSEGEGIGGSETRAGRGRPVGDSSGSEAPDTTQDTAEASLGAGSFDNIQGLRSSGSRLRRTTRQDLSYAIVIVDARRVAGIQPSTWTDYVAMVALAQVNPDVATETLPSILSLFSASGERPTAMTEWDVAYLRALYETQRAASNSLTQRREMVRRIARGIEPQ